MVIANPEFGLKSIWQNNSSEFYCWMKTCNHGILELQSQSVNDGRQVGIFVIVIITNISFIFNVIIIIKPAMGMMELSSKSFNYGGQVGVT